MKSQQPKECKSKQDITIQPSVWQEKNLRYIHQMLARIKRNSNTHTIAWGNINYRTNLEIILAKLSKFKDAYY